MDAIVERFKWVVFSLLSRFLDRNSTKSLSYVKSTNVIRGKNYVWVFCSTIGEMNACLPLIKQLYDRENLLLITDRDCYEASFLQKFPNASYAQLTGVDHKDSALFDIFPPDKVIVCEIPIRLHDAPCRLSYGLLRRAKKNLSGIYLVNGWIYGESPSCRMDTLERAFFDKNYFGLFDHCFVQSEVIKNKLQSFGVDSGRIDVAENLKFKELGAKEVEIDNPVSARIVKRLKSNKSRTIVAGCITGFWEYEALVYSYKKLKIDGEDLRLVIAPRHPENGEHMESLLNLLKDNSISFARLSILQADESPDVDAEVLVLDTFGELRAFYSTADVAYVGVNHNVLEPLAFQKSTLVFSGWEEKYPSYPVYKRCKEASLIKEVDNQEEFFLTLKEELGVNRIDVTLNREYEALLSGCDKTLNYFME